MHRSFPKPPPRLTDKTRERAAKALAWRTVCQVVNVRDGWRCRCCHQRTVKTLALVPERAEHHHLIPRSRAKRLAFAPHNVVLLCLRCHMKVTHHELEVIGPLNAEGPLTFRPVP